MFDRRIYLTFLAGVVVFALLISGEKSSAQKQTGGKGVGQKPTGTAPARRTAPQEIDSSIGSMHGERRTFIRTGVVNFKGLPRRTAQPERGEEERRVEAPQRMPGDLPLPPGLDKTKFSTLGPASGPVEGRGSMAPSPAPLASFQALPDGLNAIPPDTHGAVGPNHVMTVLNTQIRVQSRTGAILQTKTLEAFWQTLSLPTDSIPNAVNTFDPKVLYDPYQNRWIFTCVAEPEEDSSSILVAVSQTSDPTGNWNLFRVDADSNNQRWADYPSVGFNKDWIVVSVNMFPIQDSPAEQTQILVFNKAALYSNSGNTFKSFVNLMTGTLSEPTKATGGTVVPAITYDNSLSNLYLISIWSNLQGVLRIFSINGPVGNETLSLANPVFTPPGQGWSPGPWVDFAPQAGTGPFLQNNDTRIQNVVYRNGSLWATHTIFYPAGGNPNRSAVQWWQLNPTGAVSQRGVIGDPAGNTFYAFPSIAVNLNNDLLIGFSRFSGTQFVSANYAFRAGTDPLNSIRNETVFKSGEGPYKKYFGGADNRWGDYSSTVVDPVDDVSFWTIQEYASTPALSGNNPSRWGTWWIKVKGDGAVAPPAPVATPAPTPVPPAAAPGNNNFLNAQAITGCFDRISGSNRGATFEPGEVPNITSNDNIGGHSVWYKWRPSVAGTLVIDTNGSNYDTTLGVWTGSAVNGLMQVAGDDDSGDGVNSSIAVPVSASTTYYISVDGFDDGSPLSSPIGSFVLNFNTAGCIGGTQTIQFTDAEYRVTEAGIAAILTVIRTGSTSGTSTVRYSTTDGSAIQRTDYVTAGGTLRFDHGESAKTFTVLLNDDAYVESDETLTLTLSGPTNAALGGRSTAVLKIVDNDQAGEAANPIDNAYFYVRQQYSDFLNREPDQGGLDYWTDQIVGTCGNDAICIHRRRIGVSAAFFIENEFQDSGFYVYRLYNGALGIKPTYAQFSADRAQVIGGSSLNAQKDALAADFVTRAAFVGKYGALSNDAFVDTLFNTAGLTPYTTERFQQKNAMAGGKTRVQVLRDVIEIAEFRNREYYPAFVRMQYFGYLRRDPDPDGENFWIDVLTNREPGNFPGMVCSFITSAEYQDRFGSVRTRSNQQCMTIPYQ